MEVKKKIYFKCAFNYNSKLIHHNNNLWKKLERDEQGERGRRKEKEESKRKEKKRKLLYSHRISECLLISEYIAIC